MEAKTKEMLFEFLTLNDLDEFYTRQFDMNMIKQLVLCKAIRTNNYIMIDSILAEHIFKAEDIFSQAANIGSVQCMDYIKMKYKLTLNQERVQSDIVWAAYKKHVEVVEYLLPLFDCSLDSSSTIENIAYDCDLNILKLLVKQGHKDILINSKKLIQNIFKRGDLDSLRYLIEECGADLKYVEKLAEEWCEKQKCFKTVQYILDRVQFQNM